MNLAEAAAQRGWASGRRERDRSWPTSAGEWEEEIEAEARSSDYRERAVAYRALGQFRFRQKMELLRRGLEDESPACRGSALISLELLSRDAPGGINAARPLLHRLVSTDGNEAVRRLAVVCLRNGSPSRDTQVLLNGLAEDDEADRELRDVARKVAAALKKKSDTR